MMQRYSDAKRLYLYDKIACVVAGTKHFWGSHALLIIKVDGEAWVERKAFLGRVKGCKAERFHLKTFPFYSVLQLRQDKQKILYQLLSLSLS